MSESSVETLLNYYETAAIGKRFILAVVFFLSSVKVTQQLSHSSQLLKVKVKGSALVNVNKNRCSLQINTLRCKLIYTIVKVRNMNAVSA